MKASVQTPLLGVWSYLFTRQLYLQLPSPDQPPPCYLLTVIISACSVFDLAFIPSDMHFGIHLNSYCSGLTTSFNSFKSSTTNSCYLTSVTFSLLSRHVGVLVMK